MDTNLHHIFSKTSHIHFMKFKHLLANENITSNPHILSVIKKYEGCSQNELSQMLNIKPASVTSIVQKLYDNNLIEIKSDNNDLRKKNLYITETGNNILIKSQKILDELNDICFKNFSSKEIEELKNLLNKMYNNLKDI